MSWERTVRTERQLSRGAEGEGVKSDISGDDFPRLSRVSERSMPERTVDTWVASAICSVFPDARIWDPTQAMRERNWDRAFLPLEAGKVFIFEDKGTTAVTRMRKRPLPTHRIEIGAAQLDWYSDEVEPASMIPVYYVLPRPPLNGGTGSGHVPEQAICRITQTPVRSLNGLTSAVAATCARNSLADAA
jgi:hypothetical protein